MRPYISVGVKSKPSPSPLCHFQGHCFRTYPHYFHHQSRDSHHHHCRYHNGLLVALRWPHFRNSKASPATHGPWTLFNPRPSEVRLDGNAFQGGHYPPRSTKCYKSPANMGIRTRLCYCEAWFEIVI